jgi:hypothetical protein
MKKDGSLEKLRKIDALQKGGGTEGEREAAAAALDRVKTNLPLRITCTVINVDKAETFFEVEYRDIQGKVQVRKVPRELFQRSSKVVEVLLRAGAALPDDPKAAAKIVQNALDLKADTTRQVTESAGWRQGESFVYPGETFGKLSGQLMYEPPAELDPALGLRAGSLEGWREGLREPCRFSDYLIIALGQKASNALLELIGEDEGCILHLHGSETESGQKTASSSGKTLTTMAAASTTGRCRRNDLITFGITESALCDLFFAHNHLGVELDEEDRSLGGGTGPWVKAHRLSYLATSGRGNVRSNFAARNPDLKNRTWLSNTLSSGESLLDGAGNRIERTEGSQVRMIGLPVPPGAKGGIFNRVKERGRKKADRCKQLAHQVEATIKANYGVAFPALLRQIMPMRATLGERVNRRIAKLVAEVGAGAPWDARFARKIAIAGATAILLAELNIAPWSKKRAANAFRRIYRKARDAVTTPEEEAEKLIFRIRRWLSKERFPQVRKAKKLSPKRAEKGFRRKLLGIGPALLMPMERIEELVQNRRLAGAVIHSLARQGLVHLGDGGKLTRQVLVKGLSEERRRYVCFDVAALNAETK